MTETQAPSTVATDKKLRSPAYPFISLESAIERASKFWQRENKHAARVAVAATHWGYKEKSSGGLQTVSALKQHGLMVEEGAGAERKVKVTDLARQILLDEVRDSPKRLAAIKKAALAPKLYAELWQRYGAQQPSDQSFRTALLLDMSFNESVVDDVIKNYKDTIAFSKLSGSDTIPDAGRQDEASPKVVAGDFIQWESQGALQFAEPQQVTGVSEDGTHVFVGCTATGIPMEQVSKVDPPAGFAIPPIVVVAPAPSAGTKLVLPPAREVSSFQEGEAVLQWPATMSAESVLELEDWLALVVKKMKRRYGVEPK